MRLPLLTTIASRAMTGFYRAVSKIEELSEAELQRRRNGVALANSQKSLVHDRDIFMGFALANRYFLDRAMG